MLAFGSAPAPGEGAPATSGWTEPTPAATTPAWRNQRTWLTPAGIAPIPDEVIAHLQAQHEASDAAGTATLGPAFRLGYLGEKGLADRGEDGGFVPEDVIVVQFAAVQFVAGSPQGWFAVASNRELGLLGAQSGTMLSALAEVQENELVFTGGIHAGELYAVTSDAASVRALNKRAHRSIGTEPVPVAEFRTRKAEVGAAEQEAYRQMLERQSQLANTLAAHRAAARAAAEPVAPTAAATPPPHTAQGASLVPIAAVSALAIAGTLAALGAASRRRSDPQG